MPAARYWTELARDGMEQEELSYIFFHSDFNDYNDCGQG